KLQIRVMNPAAPKLTNPSDGGREHARRADGFTLVELIVTIAVAAILVSIAVPGFRHMIESNRLRTSANAMVNALQGARMEAVKRNNDAQFCGRNTAIGDNLDNKCGTAQPGAVYALDASGNPSEVRAAPDTSAPSLNVTPVYAIRFNAQGLGRKAGQTGPYTGK